MFFSAKQSVHEPNNFASVIVPHNVCTLSQQRDTVVSCDLKGSQHWAHAHVLTMHHVQRNAKQFQHWIGVSTGLTSVGARFF